MKNDLRQQQTIIAKQHFLHSFEFKKQLQLHPHDTDSFTKYTPSNAQNVKVTDDPMAEIVWCLLSNSIVAIP